MAAKKQTYEQAMKRLEEIVSRIDSNELDIDSLGVNLKEAQELIKFCRDKLYKADEEIKKMLDNNVSMRQYANVPIGCAIFCMAYLYLSTLTYWQIIKAINKKAVLIGICKYKT